MPCNLYGRVYDVVLLLIQLNVREVETDCIEKRVFSLSAYDKERVCVCFWLINQGGVGCY